MKRTIFLLLLCLISLTMSSWEYQREYIVSNGVKYRICNSEELEVVAILPEAGLSVEIPIFVDDMRVSSLRIDDVNTSCEHLTIPSSIQEFYGISSVSLKTIEIDPKARIAPSAIFTCPSLRSISISNDNLPGTDMYDWRFKNCVSLTEIKLPSKLTSINGYVFNGCQSLEHLTLPASLEYFGAFLDGCPNLTTITCLAQRPPEIAVSEKSYSNSTIILYVPFASLEAYRSEEGWNQLFSIQPIPKSEFQAPSDVRFTIEEYLMHPNEEAHVASSLKFSPSDAEYTCQFAVSDTSVAWIHPVSGRLQTKKCGDAVISITVSSVDGYTSFFKTVNLNVSPTIPNYWGGYHGNLRWDLDKDGVLCFSGQGELVNKDRLIGEREGEVTLRGYMEWDYHTGDYVFVPYDRPWSGHFVDGKEVDVKHTILMEGIVGIVDAPPFMRINKLPSTLRFIEGAYDGECLDPECELPEGLDRIGERVFASWSTLPPDNGVRINIPSTVRSIGSLGLGRFRDIDTIVFLSPTPPSVFGTSNWFSYYNTQDGYLHFESKYGIWTQPTLVSTIYVPQGFEDVYREHPVWGNYQIVGLDAITLDLEHIPSPIKPKEETLSPYYDLLGNPKNYQTKGIYIHNGKKILIQ